MQKLSGKSLLLVSFMLFSMFFGAGNLIFPPHLGAQAGTSLWPAFAGLAVSAVGLPIAGVVAVARAGGLDKLAGRVHPVFAMVFTILVYLSIGPCLAIPPHGKHLVPDAGAVGGRRYRAAAGLLGAAFFAAGLSGGAAAGKAYRLAGPHPLPLPDRAHRGADLPGVSSIRWRHTTAHPAQSTQPCPLCRASCTATRPWTRWPG